MDGLNSAVFLQSSYCLLDYTVKYLNYIHCTLYSNFTKNIAKQSCTKNDQFLLSCQNWRVKSLVGYPVLVTKVTDERPAFIPCTLLCAHKSYSPHFIHPSPASLFEYTSGSEQYKHGAVTVFLLIQLSLLRLCLYLSLGYNCCSFPVSCNHLYAVGARLYLPSFVATYNAALTLPKWAHWRLRWAPGVPLWPPSTVVGGRNFCLQ